MTRVVTEGLEMGILGNIVPSHVVVTAATDQKRSGSYSLKFGAQDGATGTLSIAPLAEFYLRFGHRTSSVNFFAIMRWRYNTTELGSLRLLQVAGQSYLAFYTSTGTLVSTGTTIFTRDAWKLLEVHVKIANSGGVLELKIDGQDVEAVFSGDTQPGADTTVNNIQFTSSNAGWFDDIAINSIAGASDNSWCGDGYIIALKPNANGTNSQLVGSDGNSTDNYLLVDEVPNDGETTYVEGSVTDERDTYNIEAYGVADTTIRRVWVEGVSRDTVAAGGNVAYGVLPSGGSEVYSADLPLLTTYTLLKGTEHVVNPADSQAWETADLNSLQIAVKSRV